MTSFVVAVAGQATARSGSDAMRRTRGPRALAIAGGLWLPGEHTARKYTEDGWVEATPCICSQCRGVGLEDPCSECQTYTGGSKRIRCVICSRPAWPIISRISVCSLRCSGRHSGGS